MSGSRQLIISFDCYRMRRSAFLMAAVAVSIFEVIGIPLIGYAAPHLSRLLPRMIPGAGGGSKPQKGPQREIRYEDFGIDPGNPNAPELGLLRYQEIIQRAKDTPGLDQNYQYHTSPNPQVMGSYRDEGANQVILSTPYGTEGDLFTMFEAHSQPSYRSPPAGIPRGAPPNEASPNAPEPVAQQEARYGRRVGQDTVKNAEKRFKEYYDVIENGGVPTKKLTKQKYKAMALLKGQGYTPDQIDMLAPDRHSERFRKTAKGVRPDTVKKAEETIKEYYDFMRKGGVPTDEFVHKKKRAQDRLKQAGWTDDQLDELVPDRKRLFRKPERGVRPETIKRAEDNFLEYYRVLRDNEVLTSELYALKDVALASFNRAGYTDDQLDKLVPDRTKLDWERTKKNKRVARLSRSLQFADAGQPHVQQQRMMSAGAAEDVQRNPSPEQELRFLPPKEERASKYQPNDIDELDHFGPSQGYDQPSQSRLLDSEPFTYTAYGGSLLERPITPNPYLEHRRSSRGSDNGQKKTQRYKQRRGFQAFQQAVNTPTSSLAAHTLSPAISAIDDIQDYIDTWKAVKNNATEIIWPFLLDMLIGTNSTMVINAAWSIYAQLIPTQWCVFGPFFYGLTSLPMLNNDSVIVHNNINQSYATDWSTEELEVNGILINLYTKAWNGSYNALKQSGHLQDLRALNYAIGYHNRSLPFDNDEEDKAEWFFQSYHGPVPADELVKSNHSKT